MFETSVGHMLLGEEGMPGTTPLCEGEKVFAVRVSNQLFFHAMAVEGVQSIQTPT